MAGKSASQRLGKKSTGGTKKKNTVVKKRSTAVKKTSVGKKKLHEVTTSASISAMLESLKEKSYMPGFRNLPLGKLILMLTSSMFFIFSSARCDDLGGQCRPS